MPPFEVRDAGILSAALAQPYQRFAGGGLYPTVLAKGACLFRGLIKNHPLIDGNKRVAVTTLATFLLMNRMHIDGFREAGDRSRARNGDRPHRGLGSFRRQRPRSIAQSGDPA